MKKLILGVAAAAAVLAGVPAFAQSADCQNGAAYGPVPGCDSSAVPPPMWFNNSGSPAYIPSNPYAYVAPRYAVPQYAVPYAYNVPRVLHRSRRDRDGDGVSNSRDRYPDNPYRW
jgi:hypothetical protein